MHVIEARNAHQALPEALYQIQRCGVKRDTRNGPVLRFPGPCTIVYQKPLERVMFWPERDANPFFHLLESLWMLAGRNDVKYPASIVPRMASFSDDGETFNGAYGYRWKGHFKQDPQDSMASLPIDQIETIVQALVINPDCRRQVLSMWDCEHDLGLQSKDLPCNLNACFEVQDGHLNMMVCNRSNDLVWGALGANVVHFSILQEYMAVLGGFQIGTYTQVSFNMHLYLDTHAELMETLGSYARYPGSALPIRLCPYESGAVEPCPLVTPYEKSPADARKFLRDTEMFIDQGPALGMTDHFIKRVALPLSQAISAYKHHSHAGVAKFRMAQGVLDGCRATDWKKAATEWIERRMLKFNARGGS